MPQLFGSWINQLRAADDIGVGANGSVWVIGMNAVGGGYGIWAWNGSYWDDIDGGGVSISVGPDGLPWVTNDAENIYERVPTLLAPSWADPAVSNITDNSVTLHWQSVPIAQSFSHKRMWDRSP